MEQPNKPTVHRAPRSTPNVERINQIVDRAIALLRNEGGKSCVIDDMSMDETMRLQIGGMHVSSLDLIRTLGPDIVSLFIAQKWGGITLVMCRNFFIKILFNLGKCFAGIENSQRCVYSVMMRYPNLPIFMRRWSHKGATAEDVFQYLRNEQACPNRMLAWGCPFDRAEGCILRLDQVKGVLTQMEKDGILLPKKDRYLMKI